MFDTKAWQAIDSEASFNQVALDTFRYQFEHLPIYRTYCEGIGRTTPTHYSEIPFLPISFFKSENIVIGDSSNALVFKSSGTTGMTRSTHTVADPSMYDFSFMTTYRKQMGNPENQVILALLPSYMEQGFSSLIYMVDGLIQASNNVLSAFLLNDYDQLISAYSQAIKSNKQVILFGVSYALLDLAERGVDLSKATIIETGGMKGRRQELTKAELHEILCKGLHVSYISSEYGMTELLSQAYSDKDGLFTSPNWMKILLRDVNDPLSLISSSKTGGINVIDLANVYSCSFIATQDLGRIEGHQFRIMGRFDHSDVRGCNLMVQ